MTTITPDEVRRIAALANLRLAESEVPRLTAELAKIVAYVEQLNDAEVDEPGREGEATSLALFEDAPGPSLPVDGVAANAPEFRDGFFVVPPVLTGES